MILIDKAKADFHTWMDREKRDLRKSYLDYTFYNALIIEWLDSIGIYVEIGVYPCQKDGNIYFCGSFFGKLGGWDDQEYYTSRQQSTEKAIEKATEIYNKEHGKLIIKFNDE